jgi:hypothetical protein
LSARNFWSSRWLAWNYLNLLGERAACFWLKTKSAGWTGTRPHRDPATGTSLERAIDAVGGLLYPWLAMAKPGNSGGADSWPGFLSELSKSFLILRDVFGYALPGAVFLSIGVLCRRFSLHDIQYYLLDPYNLPAWLAAILGLGACYSVGHVMSAIAYLRWDFPKKGSKAIRREGSVTATSPSQCSTEVSPELIDIRGRHPELLIEFERQSTMTQLRGSTGVAMVLGSILFYWLPRTPSLGWMLALAGAFQFFVFFFSAMPHIDRLKNCTIEAARLTDQAEKSTEKPEPDDGTRGIIVVTETSEGL